MRFILLIIVLLLTINVMIAQDYQSEKLSAQVFERLREENREARIIANRLNLPLRIENLDGSISEFMGFENGLPLYYETHNAEGASVINSDKVYPGGGAGLNLSGIGQTLGIWDGGKVRVTHQEFSGRAVQMDNTSGNSDHATHVAGTMLAAGITPAAKGMSYEAYLQAYDWFDDGYEMYNAGLDGLKVSQHSYGYITGWSYGSWSDNTGWYWWGDPDISETEDYRWGFYNSVAQSWDYIANSAPHYLIVKSAGNDRGTGPAPGTGHYVWDSNLEVWVYSTTVRDKDGGNDGFDTISTNGNAKNIMTVGAVLSNGSMASYSGWGPTDDGRIKPDIVAKGSSVYSAGSASNSTYSTKSGTSMSGPMISGSIGLLLHHQENLNPGVVLLSSTIKGLIIHSADDNISGNPGPDYRFGWGLMDTEQAANIMTANKNYGIHLKELTINNEEELIFYVKADGNEPLRATIAWNDPYAPRPDPSLNPADLLLLNDLDMRINDMNDNGYFPYILDPANPSNPATTGDNFRDNVEMIHIEEPVANALYKITINHKNSLFQNSSQDFSLIISGNDPIKVNLIISINENNLQLDWDEIIGVDTYNVYASDNPYLDFEAEEWGNPIASINTNQYSSAIATEYSFFLVTAVLGEREIVLEATDLSY